MKKSREWLIRLAGAVALVVLGLAYGIAVDKGHGVAVGILGVAALLFGLLYQLGEFIYAQGFHAEADSTGVKIYWPSVEEFREHTIIVRRYTPKPDGTSEVSLKEVPRGQFSPYVERHKNCRECDTAQVT